MKLLTKSIENALKKSPLYSHEGKSDKKIIVKFFNPYGAGTWYVTEGEKQEDGDWLFFGLVDLHEKEWGYFRLSELANIRPFGSLALGVERDMYFGGSISDVL